MARDTQFIDDNAGLFNLSSVRAFHGDDLIGDCNDVRGEALCSATRRVDLDEDDESDFDEDSVEDDDEEDDDEYEDEDEEEEEDEDDDLDDEDDEDRDDEEDEITLIR